MATPTDYIGLGVQPELAKILGFPAQQFTVQGASAGSASQMYSGNGVYFVNATNNGSYALLPIIGGFQGALLGDQIHVFNGLSASIQICATAGITIVGSSQAVSGTTGITLTTGREATFIPITATTYGYTTSN